MRRTVRHATLEDAAALAEIDRATVALGHGVVERPEEVSNEAEQRAALERVVLARARGAASAVWVAETWGVVAYASVRELSPGLIRHVGVLSLATHPVHQRHGHARALLGALIEGARADGLLRLELYVRDDNHRAIALYESLGFVLEGSRRAFVRLDDGTFVDDRLYGLLLFR